MKTKLTSIAKGSKILPGSSISSGETASTHLASSLKSQVEISKVTPLATHSLLAFNNEYSATQVRIILQELFPSRKLVLSQLTFFNQIGVSVPTGDGFRRGRRLYRLRDLLPIAVVLALKEQGIPNKNVESAPAFIQKHSDEIFKLGSPVQLSGIGDVVYLNLGRGKSIEKDLAVEALLAGPKRISESSEGDVKPVTGQALAGEKNQLSSANLSSVNLSSADFFWSYDVGFLALELSRVCARLHAENKLDTASGTSSDKDKGQLEHLFSAEGPKRAVA